MAVANKPIQAKIKTSKPAVKESTAHDGGSRIGLQDAIKNIPTLDLDKEKKLAKELKPRTEVLTLNNGDRFSQVPLFDEWGNFYLKEFLKNPTQFCLSTPSNVFIGVCFEAIFSLKEVYEAMKLDGKYGSFLEISRVHRLEGDTTKDGENVLRIAECQRHIERALRIFMEENDEQPFEMLTVVMPNIGWLKREAGIDYEAIKSEVKKDSTKNATEKRLDKAELLNEKIKERSNYWISRYPNKPATELYGLMQSELLDFAKANSIKCGTSARTVTPKISAVKNHNTQLDVMRTLNYAS